jgi:hypothetical protein
MKKLTTVEVFELAGAAYLGTLIGERLHLALSKKMSKKELTPGCVYLHEKTRETVIIVSVIPGGLLKKPMVEFLVGNRKLQMNLGEFLEQFEYAQYRVGGE